MKIFFSAGEPSGDLHSASLMHALREQCPDVEFCGFGGSRMEAAGCRPLLFPLAEYPVMGAVQVVAQITRFLNLASIADRYFRHQRPAAVVLVDYPGFNWWIARRAHFHRIPVFYFLPPQIWAWATWRVSKMRRFVDHVLCSLPFEADWYAGRGVRATFAGHPYFDELRSYQPDAQFMSEYISTPESPVIGILPGSRTGEVTRIFPIYLQAAQRIARVFPKARFPIACFRKQHLPIVQAGLKGTKLDARPYVGRTGEIIQMSHVCMAKSGSVSLELLYHLKPSTILYQVSRADYEIFKLIWKMGLMPTPYITLVNILAGRELFPEKVSYSDESELISQHVLRWLEDPAAYTRTVSELAELKARVAEPGATARTAEYILRALGVPVSQPLHVAA